MSYPIFISFKMLYFISNNRNNSQIGNGVFQVKNVINYEKLTSQNLLGF